MYHEAPPSEFHVKNADPCSGNINVISVHMLQWEMHFILKHLLGVSVLHGTLFLFLNHLLTTLLIWPHFKIQYSLQFYVRDNHIDSTLD